jgi:hypothetical protein
VNASSFCHSKPPAVAFKSVVSYDSFHIMSVRGVSMAAG